MGRERERRYSEKEGVERLIDRKKMERTGKQSDSPDLEAVKNRSQTGRKEKI